MPNILITGASAGIGLETAQLLCSKGYQVWGTSRDVSRLPKIENFHPLALDLRHGESIEHAFERFLEQAGTIDVLINNAGNGNFGTVEITSQKIWQEQFQTLVFGPIHLARLALPKMREQNGGMIINITSLAAQFPIPFMGPYNAAKAALSSTTQTLRLEVGNHPIHIIDLRPGDINTPFHTSMETRMPEDNSPYFRKIRNAYEAVENNMCTAPKPEIVANKIYSIIRNPPPDGRSYVGGFFQATLAPFMSRFIPQVVLEKILSSMYRLDR